MEEYSKRQREALSLLSAKGATSHPVALCFSSGESFLLLAAVEARERFGGRQLLLGQGICLAIARCGLVVLRSFLRPAVVVRG